MTLYGLILGLVITLAALIAVVAIAQACRDVEVRKWDAEIAKTTGFDPRNDTDATNAAAAKVRKTGP